MRRDNSIPGRNYGTLVLSEGRLLCVRVARFAASNNANEFIRIRSRSDGSIKVKSNKRRKQGIFTFMYDQKILLRRESRESEIISVSDVYFFRFYQRRTEIGKAR
jgi:molybdopterin biosynthesis enzyme